jgi:high affinity Mn2+ porin
VAPAPRVGISCNACGCIVAPRAQFRYGMCGKSLSEDVIVTMTVENGGVVGAIRVEKSVVGAVTAVALATGGHAFAASDTMVTKTSPPMTMATAYDWTGFYVGGHAGFATGSSQWTATQAGGTNLSGSLDLFQSFDAFKGTGGDLLGLQAGYNYMFPSRFVVGLEADVSFPSLLSGSRTIGSALIGSASYSDQVEFSGTLRGRIGYAPSLVGTGNWLFYATGGFAYGYDQLTRSQIAGVSGTAIPGTVENLFMVPRVGGVVGAGVEVGLTPSWLARLEYLYTDYASHSVDFPIGAQRFTSDLAVQTVRLGLDYRFGADGIAPESFTKAPSPLDLGWFVVHGQTTFIEQYAPPFQAPYHGQNSLDSNAGRETWDASLGVGMKLWQGAEFWFDPEVDQGFGLSNTEGVAGFVSGAAFKVGTSVPYPRMQRYFVRQTIDLGGDEQKVDADFNQFAGTQTADRLVITIGKFSPSDVFDSNKYAQNPRKDFMNWALIDAGTFDYAADAWGYSYGASAEWYTSNWTFRGGLFDLSIAPNSMELDPSFDQFQWMGEIERRYELWGHPGKLAVTGFLSRGDMGSYADAIALAQATGGSADIAAVRKYRSRPGLDMNLEQEITSDLGVFMRAGWADGNIEPYEYTDVDRTVAGGLSLKGTQWGRPNDTFALAGIVNGISKIHEEFLNDGGLGILVGDGMLPHPGLEQIIETYYQFPVYSWTATLDYQFIVNPAYNEDRGPVSVIGARMHTEF